MIPQAAAARLQLAMIAGGAPGENVLELRLFRDGPRGSEWFGVRDYARAAARAIVLASSRDVYVGACPRVRRRGRAEDVEWAWCLWADCDAPGSGERLRGFRPYPTIVNRSGGAGRLHAWWALREPVSPAQAVRANRRLALALGADRASTDSARIMRVGGTRNHKSNPPASVECVRLELDAFTLAEVVHGLPDDPVYAPRPARVPCVADGPAALGGLARIVREAPEGRRNELLNWASFRAGEHAIDGRLDARGAEAELLAAAVAAGLPEPEARRTITSALSACERRVA
jgi:hypothetical protein